MNHARSRNHFLTTAARRLTALCGAVSAIVMVAASAADGPSTTLVSRAHDGGRALTRADCRQSAISGDGRYVAFISNAVNLTPDANGQFQVFLRDTQTGAIEIVSRSSDGRAADASCLRVAISQDGRYVAYSQEEPDLSGWGYTWIAEVFVRDRLLGTTELVSATEAGLRGNGASGRWALSITPDGRCIAFDSEVRLASPDQNHFSDVYVRDRETGTTELISVSTRGGSGDWPSGWGSSGAVDISDDGSVVAFSSHARDLIPLDRNGDEDVFVRDRARRLTELVSRTDTGAASNQRSSRPAMSATGRFVAFVARGDLSRDRALWTADRVWLRDRTTQRTELVAVNSDEESTYGQSWNAAVSADGRYVAFRSNSGNLVPGDQSDPAVDVLMRDRVSGTTTRIRTAPTTAFGYPISPPVTFSADGSRIACLTPEGPVSLGVVARRLGVILYDLGSRQSESISSNEDGPGVAFTAGRPAGFTSQMDDLEITPDGRYVVFSSRAADLVQDDTNSRGDVFVRDRHLKTTDVISVTIGGATGNDDSGWGGFDISDDGRLVAFCSRASNLVPSDTNGVEDVFVRDRLRRITDRVSLTDSDAQTSRVSLRPSISGTGRWVTFDSQGTDGRFRVSLRDRTTGRTEPVSVSSAEVPGNLNALDAAISADGRLVTFRSNCTNLASGDPDQRADMLIRDRILGTTVRVGPAVGGDLDVGLWARFPASLSLDGRFLAVVSPEGGSVGGEYPRNDVVLYDRMNGSQEVVSNAVDGSPATKPAESSSSTMSTDGRWVAYVSDAFNLVPGDANGVADVFVTEVSSGITERVSVSTNEGEANRPSSSFPFHSVAPGISNDGRFIAFLSNADNLAPGDTNGTVDAFVRDRLLGTTELVSVMDDGSPSRPTKRGAGSPSISGDGRCVAFVAGDPARPVAPDGLFRSALFVRDRTLGRTERVSVTTGGATVDPRWGYHDSFGRPSLGKTVAMSLSNPR